MSGGKRKMGDCKRLDCKGDIEIMPFGRLKVDGVNIDVYECCICKQTHDGQGRPVLQNGKGKYTVVE